MFLHFWRLKIRQINQEKAMELNSKKSAVLGNVVFQEKITKSSSSGEDQTHNFIQIDKGKKQGYNEREDDSSKPPPSNKEEISSITKEDDQLESAKAKMGEVKEENEKLKLLLSQVAKDYQSLQMRFPDILQQEEAKIKNSTRTAPSREENEEESDLVSLSLGISSGSHETKKEEKKSSNLISNGKQDEKRNDNGLELGLECKFETVGSTESEKNPSSESSLGNQEEEEPTEPCPPSKIMKTVRGGNDEDGSEQMQLKKPRVSIRARCDTPTMIDGCQWRKYGQKIAKGNPCPRAYYRCTLSPTCPVRKQVQRCAEDMSILITTYEGNHNHPLPLSAIAMASTTSAAVSMLQSQSSSSQPGLGTSVSAPSTSTSSAANYLHGLNFSFAQNSRPYQCYFPHSSILSSNCHPTVTLDLTSPANSSYFSRFSSVPRYPTCLNFSSSPSSSLEGSNSQASLNTSHLTFGAFSNHNNSFVGPLNLGRQPPQEPYVYQSYMQMNNQIPSHQQSLSETITAATRAITSNPSFCTALAVALTSVVGNGGGVPRDNSDGNERVWDESLAQKTGQPAVVENEVGCASSYLGISSSMNRQQQQKQESLLLFPTSSPFPTSKDASDPPADNNNHIK